MTMNNVTLFSHYLSRYCMKMFIQERDTVYAQKDAWDSEEILLNLLPLSVEAVVDLLVCVGEHHDQDPQQHHAHLHHNPLHHLSRYFLTIKRQRHKVLHYRFSFEAIYSQLKPIKIEMPMRVNIFPARFYCVQ
jgi:hypothetical protein